MFAPARTARRFESSSPLGAHGSGTFVWGRDAAHFVFSNSFVGVRAAVRQGPDTADASCPPTSRSSVTLTASEGASAALRASAGWRVRLGLGNPRMLFRRGVVTRFVGTKRVDGRGRRGVTKESVGTDFIGTLPVAEFHQDLRLRGQVGFMGRGFGRPIG